MLEGALELAECKNWEKGGNKEDGRTLGWRFLSQGMIKDDKKEDQLSALANNLTHSSMFLNLKLEVFHYT